MPSSIRSETECASVLADYLKAQGHAVTYSEQKDDPPDFCFVVDSIEWAVEHTRLLTKIGPGSGNTDRRLIDLAERVTSEVRASVDSDVSSGWVLFFEGDVAGESNHSIVESAISRLVSTTTPQENAVLYTRLDDRRSLIGRVSLLWSGGSDILHYWVAPSIYGSDLTEEACGLLEDLLGRKASFINRQFNEPFIRRVLLIDGEWLFASCARVSRAFAKTSQRRPELLTGLDEAFLLSRFRDSQDEPVFDSVWKLNPEQIMGGKNEVREAHQALDPQSS